MEEVEQTVILAAGTFPTHAIPLCALHEARQVVCCDSAYLSWQQWAATNPTPALPTVVGDGDSLPHEVQQELGNRYIHISEQDDNDLTKAMHHAVEQLHAQSIVIVGATGLREDHTLGNISLLAHYHDLWPSLKVEMLTDHGRMCSFSGSRTFKAFPRQQVSIFSLDPSMLVSSEGLHWPLNRSHLRQWWMGTLNSVEGNAFSLSSTGTLIVFRTYDAK